MRKAATRATRTTRLITWVLMVAFVVMLSADCVTAKEMTPAQKACCAAMGHNCGAVAKEQGCCKVDSQQVEQFAAAKRVTAPPPVVVVWPAAVLPETLTSSFVLRHVPLDSSSHGPPGVPRYLLISFLLI